MISRKKSITAALMLGFALFQTPATAEESFNLDTGNAAVEVVIPTVAPIIFSDVSPTGGDATPGAAGDDHDHQRLVRRYCPLP